MAKKKTRKIPKVYELTITLQHVTPAVWRKVLVHEFVELTELHNLIQMAMGWEARHLFSFSIDGQGYTDSEMAREMNMLGADGVLLSDAIGESKNLSYTYDFGDGWKHAIEITDTLEHEPHRHYPACIGGQNACPPEDCGGPPGFQDLKNALAGAISMDGRSREKVLEWLGGFYDPTTFDPNFVNRFLLWADGE